MFGLLNVSSFRVDFTQCDLSGHHMRGFNVEVGGMLHESGCVR